MKTLLVVLILAALVTVILFSGQRKSGDGYAGPSVGQAAPNFNVKLAGNGGDLASMKGKVVLLDFWATWCGPCRESMPGLESIYGNYRPSGLEVIGITEESADKVREFLKSANVSYPMLIDHDGKINAAYGISGIPNEVLIGKDGKVAYQSTGFDGSGLKSAIEAALKG